MIYCGDVSQEKTWEVIEDESVQCCITSPPYWGLRDYGISGQIGLEKTPEEYVAKMVQVFRFVRQKLRKDGVVWLNLGDSYNGSGGAGGDYNEGGLKEGEPKYPGRKVSTLKPKDLCMIPARVALALQADGWWIRSEIVWYKRNPMPESVRDRPTKAHEMIYLLTKSATYYYDQEAVRVPLSESYANDSRHGAEELEHEPRKDYAGQGKQVQTPTQLHDNMFTKPKLNGANLKTVWDIPTSPYSGAHFAAFPPEIPERCIRAGTKKGDIVLDPFAGSGTTLEVAERMGRIAKGIELNGKYIKDLIEPRLDSISPLFS